MSYKSGCLICGSELKYEEKPAELTCCFCKKTYESNIKCINGHFVCDMCHSLSANELIEKFCISSESEDPLEIAVSLMKNPSLKMHGPEHHFLVPAVLLSVYYNIEKDLLAKKEKIKIAHKRANHILGGFCGSHGNCGAAVGTGIFISLITGANPLSEREWKLSNLITAKTLLAIGNIGGPRCCKRTTFLAIIEAVNFIRKHFRMIINIDKDIKCQFNFLNKECIQNNCPFYK